MTQLSNTYVLDAALRDLGEALESEGHRYELYVIGGAAFLLQDPAHAQATGDLDVALMLLDDGSTTAPVPLPGPLASAAAAVARIHGLSPGWINAAAAASFDNLLPDGALERAEIRHWGSLTLRIAARIDLIKLKFQAAQRRGAPGDRHRDDLIRMRPAGSELDTATTWYLTSTGDSEAARERAGSVARDIREALDG